MERLSAGVVLALNCGSSSLKFGVFQLGSKEPELIAEGEAEEIGSPEASFWSAGPKGTDRKERSSLPDFDSALTCVREALDRFRVAPPKAVGHRIVHGGPHLRDHCMWSEEAGTQLQTAAEFAPLHLPPALAVLAATQRQYGTLPQVLCLDTAFHRRLLDVSRTLPLPLQLRERGVERYGFHGLSLESILHQLTVIPRRLVIAHLGNGASITAIKSGRSIDTTMSFTPNAGVLMGTRCGDLDPGVFSYAVRRLRLSVDEVEDLLNHQSGLLGISETTRDVRELEKSREADLRADLALQMFVLDVQKAIAGMAVTLGGIDMLVFTGGIGEHSVPIRQQITKGLRLLGTFETAVFPSQEDLQIARITSRIAF